MKNYSKTPRKHRRMVMGALAILHFTFLIFNSSAQLTATVRPGNSFAEGEAPTVDTLNSLGTPTIEITGTVAGSTGLSAGSVTGTQLANSVPDGRTLDYTNTTPRALEVKASGIGVTEVSTNVAGVGLSGGGGSALRVWYDTNTLTTSTSTNAAQTNRLTVAIAAATLHGGNASGQATNVTVGYGLNYSAPTNTGVFTLSISNYTSTNIFATNWNSAAAFTNAHGLGTLPAIVRAVLVCRTNELGYVAGDEIDAHAVNNEAGDTSDGRPTFLISADATNIYIVAAQNTIWAIRRKTGAVGNTALITPSNWGVKVYARP